MNYDAKTRNNELKSPQELLLITVHTYVTNLLYTELSVKNIQPQDSIKYLSF